MMDVAVRNKCIWINQPEFAKIMKSGRMSAIKIRVLRKYD